MSLFFSTLGGYESTDLARWYNEGIQIRSNSLSASLTDPFYLTQFHVRDDNAF